MGIQGIYKEIGAGERIALSKLSADHFERTGRPLRIAVDISIWLFQIQSGKGGENPAARTFFYRLIRLMGWNIQPLFVFDGKNKPPMKRNKRTAGENGKVVTLPGYLAKQLLEYVGYPVHQAPGEAEAECALLQREGVVDMVMTEDVDALMFGTGILLKDWKPHETRGKGAPTHVTLFDSQDIKIGPSGLDREGMILVAMMSGGDYDPDGIPNIGPKVACEAARAGFGASLCRLRRSDAAGIKAWKADLLHELHTNEHKHFRSKHSKIELPETFPNMTVLGYYINPVISTQAGAQSLKRTLTWDKDMNIPALRKYTSDAFDWFNVIGARKFIMNIAPPMLIKALIKRSNPQLIQSIQGERTHASTDGMKELRVVYVPNDIVGIDLDAEPPAPEIAEGFADEDYGDEEEVGGEEQAKVRKYLQDPEKPNRIWMLEAFVKAGNQTAFETWERETAAKSARVAAAKERAAAKGSDKSKKDKPPSATQPAPAARAATLDTAPSTAQGLTKAKARGRPPKQKRPTEDVSIASSQPVSRGARSGSIDIFVDTSKSHAFPATQPARVEASSSGEKGLAGVESALNRAAMAKRLRSPVKASPLKSRTQQTLAALGGGNEGDGGRWQLSSPAATPQPKRLKRQMAVTPSPIKRLRERDPSPFPYSPSPSEARSSANIRSYFTPTPSPHKAAAPIGDVAAANEDVFMDSSGPPPVWGDDDAMPSFNDGMSPTYSPSPIARGGGMADPVRLQRYSETGGTATAQSMMGSVNVVDLTASSPVRLPLRPSGSASNSQRTPRTSRTSRNFQPTAATTTTCAPSFAAAPPPSSVAAAPAHQMTHDLSDVENSRLEDDEMPPSSPQSASGWIKLREEYNGTFVFHNPAVEDGYGDMREGDVVWRVRDVVMLDLSA